MPDSSTIVDLLVVVVGWAFSLGCLVSACQLHWAEENYPPDVLEYLRKYGL